MGVYYAHSVPDIDPGADWELLPAHLKKVATLSRCFAAAFDAGDLALAAGYLHDVGKYRYSFQRYIQGKGPRAPHASAGAAVAEAHYSKPYAILLGIVVAAHHAGLPAERGEASHAERLRDGWAVEDLDADAVASLPLPLLSRPPKALLTHPRDHFGHAFFTRMLFSALCDADFLATESFYNPKQFRARKAAGKVASIAALGAAVDRHISSVTADSRAAPTIAEARAGILAACRHAAEATPGVFTLTVPTGGGKTLSSLAFALRHAERHGLRRVVTVIPFTSIIEQTAQVYRNAVGAALAPAVIEHHSAALVLPDDEPMGPKRLRLAQENWRAPMVVTTTVQFFESLFSDRPGRCRKLHALAKSVIVLDEVQALPPALLSPCLAALARLVRDYGATVVLCTATQPDLSGSVVKHGLPDPAEIVPAAATLYDRFRRVETEKAGVLSDDDLAARLRAEPQVLCIVDNRRHAADIYQALAGEEADLAPDDLFHLSAGLCPADRRRILALVKARLEDGQPVRLVSTQVIEAGVDIDFPVVYRAAAGIDSLAQAAGRCNREGRCAAGRFVVFDHDRDPWLPDLRRRQSLGRALLERPDDPLAPAVVARYFAELLAVEDTDAPGIMRLFDRPIGSAQWGFREAAEKFRLIDEDTVPVIVPTEETEDLCATVEAAGRGGWPVPLEAVRALQQVNVSVYRGAFTALERAGAVGRLGPDDRFVRLVDHKLYSPRLGLRRPEGDREFSDNVI